MTKKFILQDDFRNVKNKDLTASNFVRKRIRTSRHCVHVADGGFTEAARVEGIRFDEARRRRCATGEDAQRASDSRPRLL